MAVNVDGSETNMKEKEPRKDRRMYSTGAKQARHGAESQELLFM